jgi:hypothetical protein
MEYVFSLWGMIIIAILCGFLGSAIKIVATQWRKARVAEIEAALKSDMIKQGRSPEEIEKVLRISGKPPQPAGEEG